MYSFQFVKIGFKG